MMESQVTSPSADLGRTVCVFTIADRPSDVRTRKVLLA